LRVGMHGGQECRCGHTRASHTNGLKCHALAATAQCDCQRWTAPPEFKAHDHGAMRHEHFFVEGDGHDHRPGDADAHPR